MNRWFRVFLQGRWFRGSSRRRLAGAAEAFIAATVLLVGVGFLTTTVTRAVLTPTGSETGSTLYFVLYLLVSAALIVFGVAWMLRLVWLLGASQERRGAITARAGELEILNELRLRELRQRRGDLPTVPGDRRSPAAGRVFGYRLHSSPRNLWGLGMAAMFSIVAVALLSTLVLVSLNAFGLDSAWVSQLGEWGERITPEEFSRIPERPWLAVALVLLLAPATAWSIYHFFRQLLKLTGIGPTVVEVSRYPLEPGMSCRLYFSQSGRVRLKLLNVDLICEEAVTYSEGTDIRTEKSEVYRNQLLRQRGVALVVDQPFETEVTLSVPESGMHSFKSTNNRIQWKIAVTAQARNWPRLRRTFPLTVFPAGTSHGDEAWRSQDVGSR